jgi:hypothetical protein
MRLRLDFEPVPSMEWLQRINATLRETYHCGLQSYLSKQQLPTLSHVSGVDQILVGWERAFRASRDRQQALPSGVSSC